MVVCVHGGPAAAVHSSWPDASNFDLPLPGAGYFVLPPNPRGSFGQGEAFTRANVKDFGYGDLRDILAGVDEAIKVAPIDPNRLGSDRLELRRLHDHVGRHADQSLQSRHGRRRHRQLAELLRRKQNRSVDDSVLRQIGLRRSRGLRQKFAPLTFIKKVKTPTLILVGDSRRRMPDSAILRILACAENSGRRNHSRRLRT